MIASIRSSVARQASTRFLVGSRMISTSRIISTAANPHVEASEVSHFESFKEYRVFAQQFGPLASHAWAKNISKESAKTVTTAAPSVATPVAEVVTNAAK